MNKKNKFESILNPKSEHLLHVNNGSSLDSSATFQMIF